MNKSYLVPAPLDYEADNQDENIGPNIQIYLDLIALILVAFFLFLAVFLNLANISTVAGKNKSIIELLMAAKMSAGSPMNVIWADSHQIWRLWGA